MFQKILILLQAQQYMQLQLFKQIYDDIHRKKINYSKALNLFKNFILSKLL